MHSALFNLRTAYSVIKYIISQDPLSHNRILSCCLYPTSSYQSFFDRPVKATQDESMQLLASVLV